MTANHPGRHGVLTLSCPDVPGIVHAVSGFLVQQQCTIVQSQCRPGSRWPGGWSTPPSGSA
jgi:formyltetrahydrofolate hydrolase